MSPEQASHALGLPAKQAWQLLHGGADFYAISPKPGSTPTVFVSNIAETTQGSVHAVPTGQQVIVPNRNLWTTPQLVNPSTLR
jgi:filamentous hemagglutinin